MNSNVQDDQQYHAQAGDQRLHSGDSTTAPTASDRSGEMLEGLFTLLKDDRSPQSPMACPSPAELKLLEDQGITALDLADHVLMTERRQYGQIEHYVEWLAERHGIPCRGMFHPPQYLDDSVFGANGFTAIDAVGLLIAMEELGIRVAPAMLVEALLPEVKAKKILTESDYKILTYSITAGNQRTVLRSTVKRDSSRNTVEKFRDIVGYRYTMTRQNGQALSLEVRGPKHRELRHEYVTCDYCGTEHETNNPSETRRHRVLHREAQQLLDPKPNPRLATRLALGDRSDIVDSDAPLWMQKEVYRRAIKFKREFRYDFVQWPGSETHRVDAGWHGYLFTAGADGTIAGACAFFNPEAKEGGEEWALQWIWVAPKYRRQGILLERWPVFVERYGDFYIEPPLSEAMKGFIAAHGTDGQKQWLVEYTG